MLSIATVIIAIVIVAIVIIARWTSRVISLDRRVCTIFGTSGKRWHWENLIESSGFLRKHRRERERDNVHMCIGRCMLFVRQRTRVRVEKTHPRGGRSPPSPSPGLWAAQFLGEIDELIDGWMDG